MSAGAVIMNAAVRRRGHHRRKPVRGAFSQWSRLQLRMETGFDGTIGWRFGRKDSFKAPFFHFDTKNVDEFLFRRGISSAWDLQDPAALFSE